MIIPPSGKKNQSEFAKSPKHLWVWSRHQHSPTGRLLPPSARFRLSPGWAQGALFLPCWCSSVPRQEEMSLRCRGAPAGSGRGAGRRRERCHRCCTVLLWGKPISLFHYLPISHRKKKKVLLILFLLRPFQSARASKGLKPKKKLDLYLLLPGSSASASCLVQALTSSVLMKVLANLSPSLTFPCQSRRARVGGWLVGCFSGLFSWPRFEFVPPHLENASGRRWRFCLGTE